MRSTQFYEKQITIERLSNRELEVLQLSFPG